MGSILLAVAFLVPSIVILLISRILAGMFAGNLTLAQAGIGDLSLVEIRVKSFALMSVSSGLAFLVGPFLGDRLASTAVVS